jgi:carbonic anhydrase/acetyltransferase-like protein (isoleucine patch superfamily)
MPPPTLLARLRQTLGRALRETGQALDRVGIRGETHAMSKRTLEDDPYLFNMPLSRHRNIFPMLRRGQPIIGYDSPKNNNTAEFKGIEEIPSNKNSDGDVFIAPCSTIIGAVRIGHDSSVWYGAILRADNCVNGMGHHLTPQDQIQWEQQFWVNLSPEEKRMADQAYGGNFEQGGAIYIGRGTNVQDGAIITARKNHTVIGDYVTIGHAAQIHSARVESHTLIGMGAILCPGSHVESFSFVAAGAVVKDNTTVKSGELWVGNPARKIRDLSEADRQRLIYQADEYVKLSKTQIDVMTLGGNVPNVITEQPLTYIAASTTSSSETK